MGNRTVKLAVQVKVSIHQIELHATYIHSPDMAVDDAVMIGHLENHRLTVLVHHLLDRKLVEVLGFIVGDLLSVNREGLGKITVAVEETYGRHINTAVRCFLDIVAGKYSKAA